MGERHLQDRKSVLALVGFTFVVWLGRVRNIILDDTLSGFDFAWSLGVAVTFCGLAAGALAANRAARSVLPARILAVVSIGYWLVRGVQIAIADHELAFIMVHSVLASVSVILSAWVLYSQLQHAKQPTLT